MANKQTKPEQPKDISTVDNEHDSIPPEMAEVLNGLPEPQREEMTRMITASFSMVRRVSPEAEVAKKITSDHISSMLHVQEKGMELDYKENQQRRIFFTVIFAMVIVAIVLVIVLLKDNPEAMTQILTALISAALGAAGGYGIGVKKRNDD